MVLPKWLNDKRDELVDNYLSSFEGMPYLIQKRVIFSEDDYNAGFNAAAELVLTKSDLAFLMLLEKHTGIEKNLAIAIKGLKEIKESKDFIHTKNFIPNMESAIAAFTLKSIGKT